MLKSCSGTEEGPKEGGRKRGRGREGEERCRFLAGRHEQTNKPKSHDLDSLLTFHLGSGMLERLRTGRKADDTTMDGPFQLPDAGELDKRPVISPIDDSGIYGLPLGLPRNYLWRPALGILGELVA